MDWMPVISFALVMAIAPGPNNITSMAFSLNKGYVKTLPYMLGIFTGTLTLMFVCGILMHTIAIHLPVVVEYMKYVGAVYILYLAYKTVKVSFDHSIEQKKSSFYLSGILLQFVNPKAYFFAITVYSTFFKDYVQDKPFVFLTALGIASYTFFCNSLWGLWGMMLKRLVENEKVKTTIGYLMAAGLVYVAIKILLM